MQTINENELRDAVLKLFTDWFTMSDMVANLQGVQPTVIQKDVDKQIEEYRKMPVEHLHNSFILLREMNQRLVEQLNRCMNKKSASG